MEVDAMKAGPVWVGDGLGPESLPGPPHEGAAPKPRRKVIVAVHGIGDQFSGATVSSVTTQFCRYMNKPAAIPFGRFHSADGVVSVAYFPKDLLAGFPEDYGFAEIYWANIPRAVVKDGYVLEEAKRWARTIAGRLQARKSQGKTLTPAEIQENQLVVQVLQEMIEGVSVMDRLLLLGRKAGLLDFNLNKLLNDFINDVQLVAEFSYYRAQILGLFQQAMRRIAQLDPDAEIHIVAHSEGTVVSYLGLLEGISNAAKATDALDEEERKGVEEDRIWTRNLKGYMTIGSPLNKHVVFWPRLFDDYGDAPENPAGVRIQWRNYYDFGDPIGFDLKYTRQWMRQRHWDRFFEFNGPEDVAEAARGRAVALLQSCPKTPSALAQPGSVAATKPDVTARLVDQARKLAEKAKIQAGKANPSTTESSVKPGKAERLARQAEALVEQAEWKLDEARKLAGIDSEPAPAASPAEAAAAATSTTAAAAKPAKSEKLHDHGFTRYYFPGVAHNDYWNDDKVFGHFIQEVVDPDDKLQRRSAQDFRQPPPTRFVSHLTSYVFPYVLAVCLLMLGVYLLYKAVSVCLAPSLAPYESMGMIARNVIGLTFLISGMTVLARLPVLSRPRFWRVTAFLVFGLFVAAFHFLVSQDVRVALGSFLLPIHGGWLGLVLLGLFGIIGTLAFIVRRDSAGTTLKPIVVAGLAAAAVLSLVWFASLLGAKHDSFNPAQSRWAALWAALKGAEGGGRGPNEVYPAVGSLILGALAFAFGGIAQMLSREYPNLGMKPLIHTGGLIAFLIVVVIIAMRPSTSEMGKWLEQTVEAERRIAAKNFQENEQKWKQRSARERRSVDFQQVRKDTLASAAHVTQVDQYARAFRDDRAVWPVVLAFPAFLYLWWLAALIFDLTFFWHRYIRHSAGLSTFNQLTTP